MNQGNSKVFKLTLASIGNWIIVLAVVWLLGSVGLGWLVNSVLILIGFILIAPIIAFIGLRWWLNRNLIIDKCPVCSYEFTALNQTQFQCPSCGEPLKVEGGNFSRLTPPGTIDVSAVEINAKQIEEYRSKN
ncbi:MULTISPECIES: hypothetical protein [Okeania]|uniref:Hydrogenase maturation nickel metallochaperone HypA n=1 Tax=Okeania hirsuta TaxID=1458930 RepID=A0A3N6P7C6_9CYAN|nr:MULTISPECIES: hypothetical protein [Okeania]NEP39853.1 hypothetical protein [Okeania sp. SIO2H7]NET13197.1 hypothetical protein [Okeania sp. SIO1H6]NEP70906.1 hypothetical protein [Okeania sp. SIO2G5]NEP92314.1 hypothetical protein [Okeania sp. SIO2F5]NEQ89958.1 hypothetical protein [Okeania sp. SIO2G4]